MWNELEWIRQTDAWIESLYPNRPIPGRVTCIHDYDPCNSMGDVRDQVVKYIDKFMENPRLLAEKMARENETAKKTTSSTHYVLFLVTSWIYLYPPERMIVFNSFEDMKVWCPAVVVGSIKGNVQLTRWALVVLRYLYEYMTEKDAIIFMMKSIVLPQASLRTKYQVRTFFRFIGKDSEKITEEDIHCLVDHNCPGFLMVYYLHLYIEDNGISKLKWSKQSKMVRFAFDRMIFRDIGDVWNMYGFSTVVRYLTTYPTALCGEIEVFAEKMLLEKPDKAEKVFSCLPTLKYLKPGGSVIEPNDIYSHLLSIPGGFAYTRMKVAMNNPRDIYVGMDLARGLIHMRHCHLDLKRFQEEIHPEVARSVAYRIFLAMGHMDDENKKVAIEELEKNCPILVGYKEILCATCGIIPSDPQRCVNCRSVCYCDRTCQKKHWKIHRPFCYSTYNIPYQAYLAGLWLTTVT